MLAGGACCQNRGGKSYELNQGYTCASGPQYKASHNRIGGLLVSTPVSCACSPLKPPLRTLRTSNKLLARNQPKKYALSNATIRVGLPSFRELYSVTASLLAVHPMRKHTFVESSRMQSRRDIHSDRTENPTDCCANT
jgi:hypothetical protein